MRFLPYLILPGLLSACSFDTTGIEGPDAFVEDGAGFALSFDGFNDFVRVEHDLDGDFTAEAWIRTSRSRDGVSIEDGLGLIYSGVPGTDNDFGLVVLNDRIAVATPTVDSLVQSSDVVTSGVWVHVAATYDSTHSQIRVYINGEPNGVTDFDPELDLSIGGTLDFGCNVLMSRCFEGDIDEVRLWSVVRSAQELQESMSATIDADAFGLMGYWRFNESAGRIVGDLTANKNDGVLGNGETFRIPNWVPSDAF